jgi:D-threonate/D-erythronate kinase
MRRMLIIADDLSGAADCGIACASHGLNAIVVLGETEDETDAEVLSVDGNTRRLTPKDAAAETARLVRHYACGDEQMLFKKLDSTLRGHVAVELAAILESRRSLVTKDKRIVAILAPAFPAHGRTTANGRQLLHGRSIEETESGGREPNVARSNIAEMLREAGLKPALIDAACVRSGRGCLEEAMTRLVTEADVLVCDAETDDDLRTIADASMALGLGTVWAGSAGLAYYVPRAAGLERAAIAIPDEALATGPTLFVVGTLSGVSREQAMLLASSPDVAAFSVPPDILMEGAQSPAWREHQLTMEKTLAAGTDMVVLIDAERCVESEQAQLLCAALARLVGPFARQVGALVVTGGESARAVLDEWGVKCLRLLGELETGLPISVTEGWKRRLPVITKAGGFGLPQTLLHCRQFLHELDHSSIANLCGCKEAE